MKKRLIFISAVICLVICGTSLKAALLGPFVVDTAEPTEAHKLIMQDIPSFFIIRGEYDEKGNRQPLPGSDHQNQLTTVLKPLYGLVDNCELSIEVPVIYSWVTQSDRSEKSGGVGDILVMGKYRFVEEDRNGNESIY